MKTQKPKFWDFLSKRYDRLIEKHAKQTYDDVIKLIKDELKQDNNILEIGTGTGLIALAIASHVESVVAIDTSKGMLELAKQKQAKEKISNINFEMGDANNLAFNDNSKDVVICMNIMHLLPKPETAISEIKRVIKPNGKIIFPTYCHGENLKSKTYSFLSSLSGFKVPNRWSIKSFHRFLETQELKIQTEKVFPGRFPLAYIILTMNNSDNVLAYHKMSTDI